MPIDARIPLMLEPVDIKVPDLEKTLTTLEQLRGARTTNAYNEYKLSALQRQDREQAAVNQVMAQYFAGESSGQPASTLNTLGGAPAYAPAANVPLVSRQTAPGARAPLLGETLPPGIMAPPGETTYPRAPAALQPTGQARAGAGAAPTTKRREMDWDALEVSVLQVGGSTGLTAAKAIREMRTADYAAEKAKLESIKAGIDLGERLIEQVVDQPTLEKAIQMLRVMQVPDVIIDRLPKTYTPEAMEKVRSMALPVKEQLNMRLKLQEAKNKGGKTDYGFGPAVDAEIFTLGGDKLAPGDSPAAELVGRAVISVHDREQKGKLDVEAARTKAGQEAAQPKAIQAQEDQLRQQYTTLTRDYRTVSDAYGRIQVSAKDPSAAGDLSLIFAYMKLLDPTSVVREGEFATAQNAGSIPARLQGLYNRVINGERLDDSIRKDFVDRSNKLYDQHTSDHTKLTTQYQALAKRQGLNPENVTMDFTSTVPRGTGKIRAGKAEIDTQYAAGLAAGKLPAGTTRAQFVAALKAAGVEVAE